MAFRTNKVPAIEERTVSGSSVSFNSAFALPLKACKVSFSATESGSGTKSPSNPYTISGVSGLNLSANSVPVSVNFGAERFGGELDLLTGILTVTDYKTVYDGSSDETWNDYSAYNGFRIINYYMKIGSGQTGIANWLDIVPYRSDFGLVLGVNNNTIYASHITDNIAGITDLASWKTFLSTHNLEIVYPLAEPITIQLSANELSSIIGNNTFSTDTGTLEITFADLQEKSASGSVATFNTALAMPLSSCNIAINAWQEGSGEPSPSNVRPIHGFSEVNVNANAVVHTIQLGQDVYGAEVDVVNGVMNDSSYYFELDGSENWSVHSSGAFMVTLTGYNIVYNDNNSKCNYFKWVQKTTSTMVTGEYKNAGNTFYFTNQDITSLDDWKSWLNTHNIQLVASKVNSDEVQITPTQITTLIGNNTIFADTGDVDLTYKDLDIAKRGNFREVFKLPS